MGRNERLALVLALNLVLVAGLVVVGISAHSVGVLAEGVDYLADAAAIGVSLLALWLAERPAGSRRPERHPEATTIAALVNGGWLLILNLLVIGAALARLTTTTHKVQGWPVLVVSGIAAVVMLGGALVLGGGVDDADDGGADLNLRAVLLDTAADAAAAAGVAITGAVILIAGGLYWLDPLVALLVAAVVTYHALRLLGRVVSDLRRPRSPSARTASSSG